MKGAVVALVFGFALRPCLAQVNSVSPAVVAPGTNDYIFTLQSGVDASGLARELGLEPKRLYSHALNGFVARTASARAEALRHDSRIVAIEPDVLCRAAVCATNIPQYTLFNFPDPPAQILPWGVERMGINGFPLAQMHGRDSRVDVDVAVMDSGVDFYSMDLNVVQALDFTTNSTSGYDDQNHGTHVSGIIGALDNGYGVVGVAPGVRIWDLRMFAYIDGQPFRGLLSWFLSALDYVGQHSDEIAVVNYSGVFGTQDDGTATNVPTVIRQAVSNVVAHGVVFVAAAGNSSQDIYGLDGVFGDADDFRPAALPECLTVSAMFSSCTNGDVMATFSNFSRSTVTNSPVHSPGAGIDLAAPGQSVPSLYPGELGLYNSGTSMAAPHVAGLVALYIAANGRAHNAADVYRIRQALIDNGLPQAAWSSTNTLDPDGNPEPLAVASENWIPMPEFLSSGISGTNFAMSFALVPGYRYTVQSAGSLVGSNVWSDFKTLTNTPTWITNNPAYGLLGYTAFGSDFTNVAPYFAATNVDVTAPLSAGAGFFRLRRGALP